eukprot:scaffold2930_cov376-Prasinococcus_capsulatus_cf.AAC.3
MDDELCPRVVSLQASSRCATCSTASSRSSSTSPFATATSTPCSSTPGRRCAALVLQLRSVVGGAELVQVKRGWGRRGALSRVDAVRTTKGPT